MLLTYALLFLLVAVVANVLGFAGLAGTAMIIAVICFGLFLGLFLDAVARGKAKLKDSADDARHHRAEH